MNETQRQRILILADTIDKCEHMTIQEYSRILKRTSKYSFTMQRSYYGGNCKTPACIAGWYNSLFPDIEMIKGLGLKDGQYADIYAPNDRYAWWDARPGTPRHIKPKRAAMMLRHLAETGRVDWSVGADS